MKIMRVVPFLDFGGVEQRVKLTAIGFNHSFDIQIQIVVLGRGGRIADELKVLGIDIHVFDESIHILNINLLKKLIYFFRKQKPDIVHTSGSEANFHGLLAARLVGIPVRIGEEIGFPNHDWRWRLIFRLVYTTATRVIVISNAVKHRIVDLQEIEKNKVHVVYNPATLDNGGQLDFELGQEIESERFVFVTICRLVLIKNLEMLIRVFAEIVQSDPDREINLWIVGEGPNREKLENLVFELDLKMNVKFWGFQAQVKPFLTAANAFVLPSFSEGFSISLVEAMLAGLTCIVTDQGGPSEIIEDGVTGFLIDPTSSISLRQKLVHVLKMDGAEKSEIGSKAKKRGQEFSIEKHIDRLMEVYKTG